MVSAVIVAAGTGARFGGDVPKQFMQIAGRPLLAHTVACFENCEIVNEILIVVAPEHDRTVRDMVSAEGFEKVVKVIHGGATRAESVSKGFDAVDADCKTVLIHDGARPNVSCADIEAVAKTSLRAGAACLVAPVTDTIKEVSGGAIVRTVDRSTLRRALTPQGFRPEILRHAMDSTELDASITDECMLLEKAGFDVATVEGSASNIKVTHPEDLILAEALLRGI